MCKQSTCTIHDCQAAPTPPHCPTHPHSSVVTCTPWLHSVCMQVVEAVSNLMVPADALVCAAGSLPLIVYVQLRFAVT
jgi:hypothetical protein